MKSSMNMNNFNLKTGVVHFRNSTFQHTQRLNHLKYATDYKLPSKK